MDSEKILYIEITHENKTPLFDGIRLGYLVKISITHEDLEVLKEFLEVALNTNINNSGSIELYQSKSRGYWDRCFKICGQTLENIFLPSEIKDDVVNHIDKFLANKTKYIKFGRIYKLCFLLTGVPGSGKSSLIRSISFKYERAIYSLSLSKKLDDEVLSDLIINIKENSILVLEDIDSFFIQRQANDINISFSALLNVFDGLFSPSNGIIIFITANNPEHLDTAMIRPGRVDRIIKFDYPRKKEILKAFESIIEGSLDEFNSFYNKVDNYNLSMASIVDYFFRHPVDYIDCVEELNENSKLLTEITEKNSEHIYR